MDMYAMYLRKSRADLEAEALGEGETLARHKNMLYELATKKNVRKEQIVIYQEIVSGESLYERPEALRLINDIYQKMYKGVFVVEVERLARGNTKDQGEVADAFKYSGTFIITPMKTYNPNDEFDEEYFEFGLFMSRREYKTIRRRMEAGRVGSFKEGNYVGSLPPYGYDIIRISKKERTLKFNDETKVVKMIFDWWTEEQLTTWEISKRLTIMGIPTKTRKPEWNRATVKDILTNHLYMGYNRWGRRKVTKEFDGDRMVKKKHRNTSEDYQIAKGNHPAIISEEQFEKAQKLFTGSVPVKAMTTITNPFAGLLVCAKCKKKMVRQHRKALPNTQPRLVHPQSLVCNVKSSAQQAVMDLVCSSLKLHIEEFEFELNNDHLKQQEVTRQTEIEAMKKELDKLKNKRKRLFDAFEDGVYSNDEFIERKQNSNKAIETIEKALKEIAETTPPPVDYESKIVKFSEVLEALKDDSVEAKAKNELLKDIIEVIEYDCEDLGTNKGGIIHLNMILK